MSQDLTTGRLEDLADANELLGALERGNPIFREKDEVEVKNLSLPSQPPMRFKIIDWDETTMKLRGIPANTQAI